MQKSKLFDAANEIQDFLLKNRIKFCFIGGLAVIRWGEIRLTRDIDVCLLCGFGNEEKIVKPILENFTPRIKDAENFAINNRVLLINSHNNIPVDITLSGLPFEEKMIQNATYFEFTKGYSLLTCSAEDLIIMKSFSNRYKDWADVESIIIRQGKKLDFDYIFLNLEELVKIKNEPEIIATLKRIINEKGINNFKS